MHVAGAKNLLGHRLVRDCDGKDFEPTFRNGAAQHRLCNLHIRFNGKTKRCTECPRWNSESIALDARCISTYRRRPDSAENTLYLRCLSLGVLLASNDRSMFGDRRTRRASGTSVSDGFDPAPKDYNLAFCA